MTKENFEKASKINADINSTFLAANLLTSSFSCTDGKTDVFAPFRPEIDEFLEKIRERRDQRIANLNSEFEAI